MVGGVRPFVWIREKRGGRGKGTGESSSVTRLPERVRGGKGEFPSEGCFPLSIVGRGDGVFAICGVLGVHRDLAADSAFYRRG